MILESFGNLSRPPSHRPKGTATKRGNTHAESTQYRLAEIDLIPSTWFFCDGWEDLNLQIQFLPSQILKLNAFEQKHFPFMFLEVYQLCTWDHAQMRNKTKETNISSIALSDYLPLASLMNLAVWHAAQVIQCCYIRTDRRKFRSQISDISKVEAGQCQESTRRQRERESEERRCTRAKC